MAIEITLATWQIVAAVATAAGAVAAFWAILANKKKRSLSWATKSATPLVSVKRHEANRIKITFDGSTVESPYLVTVRIANSGNDEITRDAFDQPLVVTLSNPPFVSPRNKIRILTAEVIDRTENSANPGLTIGDSQIEIQPTLLNSGDAFTVKAFVDGASDGLHVSVNGHVRGTTIREVKDGKKPGPVFQAVFATVLVALLLASKVWPDRQEDILQFAVLPLAGLVMVVAVSLSLARMWREAI